MSEFTPLWLHCVRCGELLSARRTYTNKHLIVGLLPLEYIHTKSGKSECVVKYEATPYDGWTASAAYERAKQKEDAELAK